MSNDPQWNAPDGWNIYFRTADIKAAVPASVDKGWMAMLADPAGAVFSLSSLGD